VWAANIRTLTSASSSGGVTLAEIEASLILAKEATVKTRLPTADYVVPDNAGIAAAKSAPSSRSIV